MDGGKAQLARHGHELSLVYVGELGREARRDDGRDRIARGQQVEGAVDLTESLLGVLRAHPEAVGAADAARGNDAGLAVDDADGFGGALAHAGIAAPAALLDGGDEAVVADQHDGSPSSSRTLATRATGSSGLSK